MNTKKVFINYLVYVFDAKHYKLHHTGTTDSFNFRTELIDHRVNCFIVSYFFYDLKNSKVVTTSTDEGWNPLKNVNLK